MPSFDAGERVRLLRVIARLNVGGPALHTVLLTERLDPSRYDTLLVAGAEARDEGNYLELRGKTLERLVRVPALGREIRSGKDLAALTHLVRLIREKKPHIVHTHTAKAGTLGRLAAMINRVPIIVHTYHGHVFDGYFPAWKTRAFLAIERWLARRTDLILTVSETVRRELIALGIGDQSKLRVVPLGLELDPLLECERLRGELRAELGIGTGVPLVGIVARLAPIKAHEVFLAAAARVAEELPDARFLVVGDGERRTELQTLAARLGLATAVKFLGWRRDLERIYADLNLVVLTSRNEGSPVALIEAMAAGRAVVATRVGGVPDVVEHDLTGTLVPADDVEALAHATSALLLDQARRDAFGRAGRERVRRAYAADRLVDDLDMLYEELLRESPRRVTNRVAAMKEFFS